MVFQVRKVVTLPKIADEMNVQDVNNNDKWRNLLIDEITLMHNYSKSKIMLELCGSKKVNDLVNQNPIINMFRENATIDSDNLKRYHKFEFDLIAAMREDLLGKRRWQFWK